MEHSFHRKSILMRFLSIAPPHLLKVKCGIYENNLEVIPETEQHPLPANLKPIPVDKFSYISVPSTLRY